MNLVFLDGRWPLSLIWKGKLILPDITKKGRRIERKRRREGTEKKKKTRHFKNSIKEHV